MIVKGGGERERWASLSPTPAQLEESKRRVETTVDVAEDGVLLGLRATCWRVLTVRHHRASGNTGTSSRLARRGPSLKQVTSGTRSRHPGSSSTTPTNISICKGLEASKSRLAATL
ncbi:hypothetical protein O3P69_002876 [Scylla paramamosain]|uniref:Uncharacterized protein n=1 Tax=Scylla paramamosain TaxID=85552 RepID=A0AAW0URL8_SCYPA